MNLLDYDAIILNISGGKDSQTIIGVVMAEVKKQGYSGDIIAIHADTKAEWPQSLPHCELLCKHYQIRLVVADPFRPLPEHIERRCKMMAAQQPRGKPGWPSPAQRYCTSDCKRAPIEKAIRSQFSFLTQRNILTVTGERREESAHRAKLSAVEPDKTLTAGSRTVTKWRPILDYLETDVWSHIRKTGLPRHTAYDLGNKRLSCAMCIMACEQDLRNGAKARPDLAEMYVRIERETGFSFMHKKSLESILANKAITQ